MAFGNISCTLLETVSAFRGSWNCWNCTVGRTTGEVPTLKMGINESQQNRCRPQMSTVHWTYFNLTDVDPQEEGKFYEIAFPMRGWYRMYLQATSPVENTLDIAWSSLYSGTMKFGGWATCSLQLEFNLGRLTKVERESNSKELIYLFVLLTLSSAEIWYRLWKGCRVKTKEQQQLIDNGKGVDHFSGILI